MDRIEKYRIKNSIEELPNLAVQIEQLEEDWGLPLPLIMKLNLVLEEAASNVIFYAFDDADIHWIDIELGLKEDILFIRVEDDGKPFDPTLQKAPDTTLSLEEREIGGLGILLITKMMDTVRYERLNDKNTLLLSKKINE